MHIVCTSPASVLATEMAKAKIASFGKALAAAPKIIAAYTARFGEPTNIGEVVAELTTATKGGQDFLMEVAAILGWVETPAAA